MAYVTLDEFKKSPVHSIDWEQLVPGGTQLENDDALSAVLEAASERVNAELDVDTLLTTTTTDTVSCVVNRYGDVTIRTRNWPVKSVVSAKVRFPGGVVTTVPSDRIDVFQRSIVIRGVFERGKSIPPVVVEVTYESGYEVDDLPESIKTATILFAASLIKQRGSESVTMSGTPSIMGGSPYDQTDEAKAVALLKPFKRVVF